MANYIFPDVPGDKLQVNDTITFKYTGDVQVMDTSKYNMGLIRIECFGARSTAAKGGYAFGEINFSEIKRRIPKLYFVCGQYNPNGGARWEDVSFGGGGACDGSYGNGGGASDVRTYYDPNATDFIDERRSNLVDKGTITWKSLSSRLIVAAGAGATDNHGRRRGSGAPGGGWVGYGSYNAGAGRQDGSSGGDSPGGDGRFGCGGSAWSASGAGGGGLYGGAGKDGGAGGSSYVSGNPNCPFKTSSGITFSNSGTEGDYNLDEGKIIITLIGGVPSTKKLCYQKRGKPKTEIALYQNPPSKAADGCVLVRVNQNDYTIAVDKKLTKVVAKRPPYTPDICAKGGRGAADFTVATYSFTPELAGTYTFSTEIIWDGAYYGAPDSWWANSFYVEVNDFRKRRITSEDACRLAEPMILKEYEYKQGDQFFVAHINSINEYANKRNCSGPLKKVIINIPLTFAAGETKNIRIANLQKASKKDSSGLYFKQPIEVLLGGKYSQSPIQCTDLTVTRNGKDYCVIQDCKGGLF